MTVIAVYRRGSLWRFSAWVDGETDCFGDLGIDDNATEAKALDAARKLYPMLAPVRVSRIADVDVATVADVSNDP